LLRKYDLCGDWYTRRAQRVKMFRFVAAFAFCIPLSAFTNWRTITIDHAKVASDQAGLPLTITLSDAGLKTTGNGGHVQTASCFDCQFFLDAGHSQRLFWQIESYDGSAGTLVAHVRVPQVSHTLDSVIYLFYGDYTVATFQGGAPLAVWGGTIVPGVRFTTFSTLGTEQTAIISTPLVRLPINTTAVVPLVGAGTAWSDGTPFTATGVSGAFASFAVQDATHATATVTIGNNSGILSVSDGANSLGIPVMSPGFSLGYGGFWDYNTQSSPHHTFGGDSLYLVYDGVGQLYTTADDTSGIDNRCNSNNAMFKLSLDLKTLSLANCFPGLGAINQSGLGMCTSGSIHVNPPFAAGGWMGVGNRCDTMVSTNMAYQLTTVNDGWAHIIRSQDSTAVSAASWSGGVATLTLSATPGSAINAGDFIVVSGCDPGAYNTLPNMPQTVAGTSGTTIKYNIASDPGTYVSGCRVWGPGSARGSPATAPIYAGAGNMVHEAIIAGSYDGTYDYFISSNGAFAYSIAGRINRNCFVANPADKACREVWIGPDDIYSSDATSATPLTCITEGVSNSCGGFPSNVNAFRVIDPNLPDGARYMALTGAGNSAFGSAAKPYGPWLVETPMPVLNTSVLYPPVATTGSTAQLYTGGPTTACVGVLSVYTGTMFKSTYSPLVQSICLRLKDANMSKLFHAQPGPGRASYGNQFGHIQHGLIAFWDFTPFADMATLQDKSANGLNLLIANVHNPNGPPAFLPELFITSPKGLENPNSALNGGWYGSSAGQGGNWMVDTSFTDAILSGGDFTVGAVFSSTASGTQYLASGTTTGNVGWAFKIVGNAVHFVVRNGAAIDVTCPGALSVGVFSAYIAMRYQGTGYCFKIGTTSPSVGGSDANSLGTYTLSIAGFNGGSADYLDGEIGGLYVWNRALCSSRVAGSCSAVPADEVQREFSVIKREGVSRGWGL
jgi:hypothetical protein